MIAIHAEILEEPETDIVMIQGKRIVIKTEDETKINITLTEEIGTMTATGELK